MRPPSWAPGCDEQGVYIVNTADAGFAIFTDLRARTRFETLGASPMLPRLRYRVSVSMGGGVRVPLLPLAEPCSASSCLRRTQGTQHPKKKVGICLRHDRVLHSRFKSIIVATFAVTSVQGPEFACILRQALTAALRTNKCPSAAFQRSQQMHRHKGNSLCQKRAHALHLVWQTMWESQLQERPWVRVE
jgi:hypothetical protein